MRARTLSGSPHAPWRRAYASRWRHVCRASESDEDFVTKMFGAVFGQKALEDKKPMGLTRIPEEERQELFPATTDEWAELLDSDTGEVATIRPLLAGTSLEQSALRLAFDADTHGWGAEAFHNAVNTFGAGVVIAQTFGGAIIGGYNPSGWIGLGEDRDSMAAFLFTWPEGDVTKRPIKLPKVGGDAQAVLDRPESGPLFGPDGLRIPLSAADPKRAFSKLGSYYARRPDGVRSLFAQGEEAKRGKGTPLQWLRAYVGEGGPEQWKLEGIVWQTSRAAE